MAANEKDKITRIHRLFERDERERPLARTLNDVPAFYECITPEWLTAVIRRRHPEATVTGFKLDVEDSGTTNRRRIFLEYATEDQDRGYPKSLFCKAAQDLKNRVTMSAGSAEGETYFYATLRTKLPIEAPHAYFAKVDLESYAAIIVLEDLGSDVEFCTSATPMNRARAESQIALLARMHSSYYGGRGDWNLLHGMDSFPARFHKLNDFHGMADACQRGLIASEPVMPPSLMARADEVWPLTLNAVDRLLELPQTITHGDVHLGNWYIRAGDVMGLADFQNVTIAHWSRDLAYAISTALTVADRRHWERDLVKLYLDEMRARCDFAESWDNSWTNYRQQMLSTLAYWTVTLTPSPSMAQDMQSKETTLTFLERIGAAIADLESLDAF